MATGIENLSDDTRDELARTMLAMTNNTKTRRKALEALKEIQPSLPIPEIDEPARIEAALVKEREKFDKLQGDFNDYRLRDGLTKVKSEVSQKFGLSDEDMKKMEERMTKGELPIDYNFAARLYNQEKEVATPSNYGTSGYGPLDIAHNAKQFEGLMEDESGWSNRTAHSMIDEMQKKGFTPSF